MSFKALPFPLSILWSCDVFLFEFNCCLKADSFYVCHVLFYLESETVPGTCTTTQTQFSVEILENLDLAPSQHYSYADVTSPRDLNESGKPNSYKRVNLCHFWSEVQGCRSDLRRMSGEPPAVACDVALGCL